MLDAQLKTLLGSTFVLYTKVHGFHWNIEGENFPQYHKFLNKFYTDVYETIDVIGEYIRTLDTYTPGCLSRMLSLSIIPEQDKIPRAELMFEELYADTAKMIEFAVATFDIATSVKAQGIANYMAELQDLYSTKQWMIRSILKKSRA